MIARGCLLNVNAYMKINYPDFSCAMEKLEIISFWGGENVGGVPHNPQVAVQVEEFIV